MEYAKVSGKNVVIKLPIDLLVTAFNDNPNNWDENIKVKYKLKFAKGFVEHINNGYQDSETGLSAFQEWIDSIFDEMLEGDEEYITYPNEDE